MKTSTTQSKILSFLRPLLVLLFWLSVWELAALIIGNSFLLPDIKSTFSELLLILSNAASYRVMLLTLLRVSVGLFIGIILGIGFGILAHSSNVVYSLLSPFITVIRSTPVASFIIVLWVIFSGDVLSVLIAFLMVMPIIWQSTVDGFNSIDRNLEEVARVFRFGYLKKIKLIVFPALLKFLLPAIVTSVGLAWKAEIAAEIIAYTKNSIGQKINDAKYFMDTPRVFAWTVVVIIFSILLERITKSIIVRFKNEH